MRDRPLIRVLVSFHYHSFAGGWFHVYVSASPSLPSLFWGSTILSSEEQPLGRHLIVTLDLQGSKSEKFVTQGGKSL